MARMAGLDTLDGSRRRLVLEAAGIALSTGATGTVFGLAARQVGLSPVETIAMSTLVLAGASQFAALGLLAAGAGWFSIVVLTFLLNARHLLYSASLAPWFSSRARRERLASAHVLTDETFALSLAHFHRLGRWDGWGYWMAAAFVCLPWIVATVVGYAGGALIPDPQVLGLDVVFPAAMAGLAVGLIRGAPERAAALAAVVIGVTCGLTFGPALGVVAGGIGGPLVGLLVPGASNEPELADEPLRGLP
jgi:branched chain amino acid efflux pump